MENFKGNLKNFKKLKNSNNNLKKNSAKKAPIYTIFQIIIIIKNFYIQKLKITNLKFNFNNYKKNIKNYMRCI